MDGAPHFAVGERYYTGRRLGFWVSPARGWDRGIHLQMTGPGERTWLHAAKREIWVQVSVATGIKYELMPVIAASNLALEHG